MAEHTIRSIFLFNDDPGVQSWWDDIYLYMGAGAAPISFDATALLMQSTLSASPDYVEIGNLPESDTSITSQNTLTVAITSCTFQTLKN